MSTQQKHNFGAGPCILPISVMEKAASSVINWDGSGLSILEVSHRSAEFEEVVAKTQLLVRELLSVPEDYEVLFLQGGASTQFSMVPQNLLQASGNKKGAYLDTGYFAQKAIEQARHFGEVQIVASSREKGYNYIPDNYSLHHDAAYLHLTSNNTIEGTEIFEFRNFGVPLVCDMSSDIFSREIKVSDFDLIYAGAQKNMGPAGMTLVIIKKTLLTKIKYPLPAMYDYRTYAANNSMYNTPPVFSIYVSMLNLLWLKDQGGVSAIEKQNIKKAELLYEAIDKSEIFYGTADGGHRSRMNVTFQCRDKKHENGFLNYAQERGIVGTKGYRSVGGFRASLYNALPLFSVEFLVKTMAYYEKMQEMKNANQSQKIGA
ncbi:3-phosphoserine/phosphohydroxythreonine transaminase [Pedobacter sp. LMG 31464]|uniref:Phosphoserine aminotransferase n=1 Tax=Pedobacter planticolens TaxID=2679964 RepID=A0A923DZ73_9SPHI|nr:3-phosphoserine/phosphohydroxythreonine transaminase [Pedobacter planticolens]MBB2146794.1 3-phosphoserine/phosphohydroxythreonine transaminase [Pedobacter planticolens]